MAPRVPNFGGKLGLLVMFYEFIPLVESLRALLLSPHATPVPSRDSLETATVTNSQAFQYEAKLALYIP